MLENDHYVIIARAHQMLRGAWPIRDFEDPGMFLAYVLSAGAAIIGGPTLLPEVVLSVGLLAIAAALTVIAGHRLTGSVMLGAGAAGIEFLLRPRLYNSLKVLIPVAAVVLACRYARRGSRASIAALAAWTAVGFLARHDYVVYLSMAALPLIVIRCWPDRRAMVRDGLLFAAVVMLVLLPWLVYVQWAVGLGSYLSTAVGFAAAESARTNVGWPVFGQSTPVDLTGCYLALLLPVVLLATAARQDRQTRAAWTFLATLTLLIDVVFLRDAFAARLPDVAAIVSLVAITVASAWLSRRLLDRLVIAGGVLGAMAIAGFVTVTYGIPGPGSILNRARLVADRMRTADPQTAGAEAVRESAAWVARCTPPQQPVMVVGFAPEIPVLARRSFAGGQPNWLPGYYESDADEGRALARLRRNPPAAAVVLEGMLEGPDIIAERWPDVARWMATAGYTAHRSPRVGNGPVVWTHPTLTGRDADTGLPCTR